MAWASFRLAQASSGPPHHLRAATRQRTERRATHAVIRGRANEAHPSLLSLFGARRCAGPPNVDNLARSGWILPLVGGGRLSSRLATLDLS